MPACPSAPEICSCIAAAGLVRASESDMRVATWLPSEGCSSHSTSMSVGSLSETRAGKPVPVRSAWRCGNLNLRANTAYGLLPGTLTASTAALFCSTVTPWPAPCSDQARPRIVATSTTARRFPAGAAVCAAFLIASSKPSDRALPVSACVSPSASATLRAAPIGSARVGSFAATRSLMLGTAPQSISKLSGRPGSIVTATSMPRTSQRSSLYLNVRETDAAPEPLSTRILTFPCEPRPNGGAPCGGASASTTSAVARMPLSGSWPARPRNPIGPTSNAIGVRAVHHHADLIGRSSQTIRLGNVGHAFAIGPCRVDPVAAVAGITGIVAKGVTLKVVVAAATGELVALVAAVEEVVATAAEDRVTAPAAQELVVPAPAGQDVAAAL